MRTNGVDEKYITGDAADFEKLEIIVKDICYYNAKNYFNF